MTIEQVKEFYGLGMITLLDAMTESQRLGYNMAKMGKCPKTGMGGKFVWFKK